MSPRRAAVQVLLLWGGFLAVSAAAFALVYPRVDGWAAVAAQVVAYLLTLVPVVLLRPRARIRLALGRRGLLAGILLIGAAVAWAAVVLQQSPSQGLRHAGTAISAGVGEEVLFRGAIHDRLGAVTPSAVGRVAADAVLFAVAHVVVALHEGAPLLLVAALMTGTLLGTLRERSGGIGLPAAVHVAIDLSS